MYIDIDVGYISTATFPGWTGVQRTDVMAAAGFWSAGERDIVKCFCCGVTFTDWQPNDEPWEIHALYMPACAHVRAVKGTEFVSRIVEVNQPTAPTVQPSPVPSDQPLPAPTAGDKSYDSGTPGSTLAPLSIKEEEKLYKDVNTLMEDVAKLKSEKECKVTNLTQY